MILHLKSIPQNCALTSLNQMWRIPETAPSSPLRTSLWPVVTRLGALPKLPLQNCARSPCAAPRADWADGWVGTCRNWDFMNIFNVLCHTTSYGGESHPLRGWGRTATSGFSHSHPQGLRAHKRPCIDLLPGIRPEGPGDMRQHPSPIPLRPRTTGSEESPP
jgi:hypothetical protein